MPIDDLDEQRLVICAFIASLVNLGAASTSTEVRAKGSHTAFIVNEPWSNVTEVDIKVLVDVSLSI